MKLFERVRQVSETLAPSQTALAKALGLSQSKFHHYLDDGSEKNLWQYLPRILEIYPQVSREWLYFGEGEMLAEAGLAVKSVSYDTMVKPVAGRTHSPDKVEVVRVVELERMVADLRRTVAAQEELLAVYRERAEGRSPLAEDAGTLAPGVPLLRRASDRDKRMTEES